MQGLLTGVRVVEFSQLLSAPVCGLMLSDLGADVIKVEPPGGEATRRFPPWLAPGESGYFHAVNRGKRGVTVNLGEDDGREFARQLVSSADVVVENLGDARRTLGFHYQEALEENARLVWCSITGWGHGQPGRSVDPSLQAATGIIALNGEPDGPPVRVPVPIIDLTTATYAVFSVIAALWKVERGEDGGFLDCAMVDTAAMLSSLSVIMAWGGHLTPRRLGSESAMVVPSRLFEARDGRFVQIICVSENHWRALCRALARSEWIDDPRFNHLDERMRHRQLVHQLVAEQIACETADHWVEVINREGSICEPVRDIEEGWDDPRLRARGLMGRAADPELDTLPLPTISLIPPADPGALERGPRLGEHNDILATEVCECLSD